MAKGAFGLEEASNEADLHVFQASKDNKYTTIFKKGIQGDDNQLSKNISTWTSSMGFMRAKIWTCQLLKMSLKDQNSA